MTGRERFLRTFQKEQSDCMPVSLFIQEQGHFMNQIHPEISEYDYDGLQKAVVDFQREAGSDVFLRILFDEELPLHVLNGGVNISTSTPQWIVETKEHQEGSTTVYSSTITTPEGVLTQDFSINRLYDRTLMYACTKKPVQEEEDLDLIIKYEPKMNPKFPASFKKRVQRMKEYVGEDGIVGAWVPFGVFNNASHLVDLDELYSLFLSDPEYYEKLLEFSLHRFDDYAQAYMESGLDAFLMGGNVPGGFIGKRNYDTYVLPYEKQCIRMLQSSGIPCIYHNCGEIMALIESYKELGVRIVEPFSPPPLGDTRLEEAVKTIDGSYIMTCGVNQVGVIQKGTVEDVIAATRQTVAAIKTTGYNIIQNADFLEYNTPIENVKAFVRTARETT